MPIAPTRFPRGLTNARPKSALQRFGLPDPSQWHVWFDDFDGFTEADWEIVDEGGGGTATVRLIDADGGLLQAATASSTNAAAYLQWTGSHTAVSPATPVIESFTFEPGKQTVFKTRLRISRPFDAGWVMGLQIEDQAPLQSTNSVVFTNLGTTVIFVVQKTIAGNTTTDSFNNVGTIAEFTFVELAYHYDGFEKINLFFNDRFVGDTPTINLPPSTQPLTISFGIQHKSTLLSNAIYVDYILVAKER